MAITDVTIYGAGIFGLSIAWECLGRGARVQVIDPNGPGAGASGGLVGALAPHTPERWEEKKQFQLDSLLMAADFWANIETASGLPSSYKRAGRVLPLANERGFALAQARTEDAKILWQDHARWQVLTTNPHPGWVPESPVNSWVFDTLSARMSPRMAGAALAAAIVARGGSIARDGTPRGAVIWATGVAGLADLSDAFGSEMGNGQKGQSALLDHDARDLPQVFAEGVHIIPHADGRTAIGSTSERYYTSPNSVDEQLEDLLERARGLCPDLRKAKVLERWAGLRPRSKTRAPMLGAWPGREGHFIANGGFKIGFGMAPKVAEVMADLVLNIADKIPADFRVEANL